MMESAYITRTPTKASTLREGEEADASTKRLVSDNLVTLHKCVQDWHTDNQKSFETLTTLCSLYAQWNSADDVKDDTILTSCTRDFKLKLYDTREDLLIQVKEHRRKLEALYSKMVELLRKMKALHFMGCGKTPVRVFNNGTVHMFYTNCRLLVDMFSKEFMLKTMILCELLKYRCEEDGSGENLGKINKYTALWLHQPHIDSNKSKFLLDSMLIEAELK